MSKSCKQVSFKRSNGTRANYKACGGGRGNRSGGGNMISGKEDMGWLADVHVPAARKFGSAMIYGNEDAPSKIELYRSERPEYTDLPVVYLHDENTGLMRRAYGPGGTARKPPGRRAAKPAGQRARRRVYKTNAGLLRAMGSPYAQLSYDHFRSQHANIKGVGWTDIKVTLTWDQAHEIADALGGRQRTKNQVASVLTRGAHGTKEQRHEVYQALGSLASRIIWTPRSGWQYVAGQDYTAETARMRRWLTAIY